MNTTESLPQEPAAPVFAAPRPASETAPRWDRRATIIDDPRRKSVMLAGLLSALPGLGQVYVGYYQHGVVNIVAVGTLMTIISRRWLYQLEPLLVMFVVFLWAYNIIDAARRAALYNQSLMGLRPMDLPENQPTPDWRGSIAGGVALVALGLALFTNTMFGWSLHWIEQWWPMGFVAFGAWLIYASLNKQKATDAPTAARPSDAQPFQD
jgi:hypothetical protein